jgi:anti-sigma-K factor RskA
VSSDRTYQLWSIDDGRAISVGLLGEHPSSVAFTVDPSVAATAYLVTVEPAGGVVAPTSAPVAQATV